MSRAGLHLVTFILAYLDVGLIWMMAIVLVEGLRGLWNKPSYFHYRRAEQISYWRGMKELTRTTLLWPATLHTYVRFPLRSD